MSFPFSPNFWDALRLSRRAAGDATPNPARWESLWVMTESVTVDDVYRAKDVLTRFLSLAPLIRSFCLEDALQITGGRRVWIKDYGWTPVGSFKLMGALNWVAEHEREIGSRPIAAHSSGNFASGIAFAAARFGKRAIIVMPDSAPQVKFNWTRALGAEIRTYDIASDHQTGVRDRLTSDIAEQENGVQASPYDDPAVIAGNGVGGLEIAEELKRQGRDLAAFFCPVSGGGLMAGHALTIADQFPPAKIVGVEPAGANDFSRSMQVGRRVRIEHPSSICDGLLSYDVGLHNWPILRRTVSEVLEIEDSETCRAMRWLWENHGLMTEPSGAIAVAALLAGRATMPNDGDIVVVISGRNVDPPQFERWINSDLS